ncbi:MAG: hypothetical protein AB8B53_09755 [Flavobacteriales bacterium]
MLNIRFYLLLFTLAALGSISANAQSELNIHSEDSTLFLLKVNTELISDSLSHSLDLRFTTAESANLVVLDSAQTPLLEENIALPKNFKRVYQLRQTSSGWRLVISSEFELTQNNAELIDAEVLANTNTELETDSVDTAILITSSYKSASSPNLTDIAALDDMKFEREKLRAIQKMLSEKTLTSSELNTVLQKVSFEDKRAELIEQYADLFYGSLSPQNIEDLFKLDRYRSQALKALGL